MKKQGPIGVFDSGYGGLTILKELRQRLPQYDYLYLGDNARAPYGSRSFDVVYEYTKQAVEELFSRGCSLVIVACNTASSKALRTIQQHDIPKWDSEKRVLGVIRPSTEEIGSYSQSGHVGIVATEGTVRSNSYELELAKSFPALSTEMSAPAAFAVKVAAPVMSSAPVLVMSPVVAVTLKLLATVEAPRTKPFTSFIMTSLPLTIDTAPTKLLLLLKVTVLSAPAVTVVVPPMLIIPGTLTAPLAVIVKLPF